jgi:hypothetical protein
MEKLKEADRILSDLTKELIDEQAKKIKDPTLFDLQDQEEEKKDDGVVLVKEQEDLKFTENIIKEIFDVNQ